MAKQRLMHGATLDAATPDEVARIIAAAFTRQESVDYTREKGALALSAAGAFSGMVAEVPASYDWLCERVAIVGKAGAIVNLFEGDASAPNLLESITIPASGFYSDSFSNNLYLSANSILFVTVTGGDVSGQMTFNIQVKLRKRPQ